MRRLDYEISRRATREIVVALTWWRENRQFAPDLLTEEIESAIEAIADQPGIGAPVRSRRFDDLRRYSIGRTGYWFYYRVRDDRPRLLALWHERRGRGPGL